MLQRTDAITNDVLAPITFVLAYHTAYIYIYIYIYIVGGNGKCVEEIRWRGRERKVEKSRSEKLHNIHLSRNIICHQMKEDRRCM